MSTLPKFTIIKPVFMYYVCTCPRHATAADFGISDVIIKQPTKEEVAVE